MRYRTSPQVHWQWVNEQFGTKDGQLVFEMSRNQIERLRSISDPTESLAIFVDKLNPELNVDTRRSDSPDARVWALSSQTEPAGDGRSGIKDTILGFPTDFARYFSLVRIWSPWLGPRHGANNFKLTEDSILLSFMRNDGTHLVMLAVGGLDNVLTCFRSGPNGEVVISTKNDNKHLSRFHVLIAVAPSFDIANCAVVYEARKFVRPYHGLPVEQEKSIEKRPDSRHSDNDLVVVEKDPKTQWMTDWFDGLTFCTWNSLGQDLSEEKILSALATLRNNGIRIANLIIDDNWQSLDNEGCTQFERGWMCFEANKKGFPNGLRHTISRIREENPSVEHIAVWHALMGYWGGISPVGVLAEKYQTKIVKKVDGVAGGYMTVIDPDDIQRFYNDFYSFLSNAGIDSVKSDAQFFLDLLENPEDRRRFTTAYQDAWYIAMLKNFQARAISCMSQVPQIIFHSHVPTDKPRLILRNSDDFFPDVESSHTWHVFCNAHNALFTQRLNVVPDWDMFQTSHPYAFFHAAARCVSGGPIYITDVPGKHNFDLINQMAAPTTKGKMVILRPSVLGAAQDIYHNFNEGHILKVGCYDGWAKTGSGMLGLFNISSGNISSLISLIEFPGVVPDGKEEYIIRSHWTGGITHVMQPSTRNSLVSVSLPTKGCDVLTAYPVRSFTLAGSRGASLSCEDGFTRVAILGLLGKMTAVAAIVTSDIFIVQNGRLRFDISLKALGTLGIYVSDLDRRSVQKDFMVFISGKVIPTKCVRMEASGPSGIINVLAIDVLTAWKEMGLVAGWSNDIVVQVFMR